MRRNLCRFTCCVRRGFSPSGGCSRVTLMSGAITLSVGGCNTPASVMVIFIACTLGCFPN